MPLLRLSTVETLLASANHSVLDFRRSQTHLDLSTHGLSINDPSKGLQKGLEENFHNDATSKCENHPHPRKKIQHGLILNSDGCKTFLKSNLP